MRRLTLCRSLVAAVLVVAAAAGCGADRTGQAPNTQTVATGPPETTSAPAVATGPLETSGTPALETVLDAMRAADAVDTVEARLVSWFHAGVWRVAAERADYRRRAQPRTDGQGELASLRSCTPSEPPATYEYQTSLLLDRPGRLRLDDRTGDESSVRVWSDGRYVEQVGAGRRAGDQRLGPLRSVFVPGVMLEPADLTRLPGIEVVGTQDLAGVDTVVLTAGIPADDPAGIGVYGGDQVRLWVDPRTGLVHQMEARTEGEAFFRSTPEEVRAGRPIAGPRFEVEVPAGARVLDLDAYSERATSAEASRRVSFPVLTPGGRDRPVEIRFETDPASDTVSYELPGDISVDLGPADDGLDCSWPTNERIERDGVVWEVLAGAGRVQAIVGDTTVVVSGFSDRSPAALIDVAATLQPLRDDAGAIVGGAHAAGAPAMQFRCTLEAKSMHSATDTRGLSRHAVRNMWHRDCAGRSGHRPAREGRCFTGN